MANDIEGLRPDGTLPTRARTQVSQMIQDEAPPPDLTPYPTRGEVDDQVADAVAPLATRGELTAAIDAIEPLPEGDIPIFSTMAQAQAWEAANPGRAALTTETQDPDVIPPTPGTLSVAAGDISAALSVSGASDDRAVAGYSFKVGNGDWSTWQVGSAFTATGLTPSTSYTFQHRVRDAAYNIALGAPVSRTTSAMTSKTPSQIGSLWGHWDASVASSITSEAGQVSAWTDRTANARQLAQATSAQRPATASMGSRVGVRFTRAQQDFMRYQSGFSIDVAAGYTLCWIGRFDEADLSATQAVASVASGASLARRTPDGLIQNTGSPPMDGPQSVKPAQGEVVFMSITVKSGGPSTVRVSGVSGTVNSASPSNNPGTAFDVGRHTTSGQYGSSTVGEVWVHDRPLTTSELDALRMYAQAKWGAT